MRTLIITMLVALVSLGAYSQVGSSARVDMETQCLGVEEDGTQTLRAWGFGKKKKDAVEQAMKNAVRDVLFKGIRSGMEGCDMRPMITEVNARERYADYFNKFFADGGKYKNYVSLKDKNTKKSRESVKSSLGTRWSVTVRILCPKLRERLVKDKILPKVKQKNNKRNDDED